jgi:PAS domain-containing protein
VIIADTEGRVLQTNEEVLRILKSVEQTRTDSYGEFLSWWEKDGRFLKNKDGPLMRALSLGHSTHNQVMEIKCLDGTPKSVFTSASPLRGPDRRIVGAVAVLHDVTAQREIEADIEKRIVSLVSSEIVLEKRVVSPSEDKKRKDRARVPVRERSH